MGYNTEFKGQLKFVKELSTKALQKLSEMLGEDCRDHPEWGSIGLTHIDLRITKDFSGLEWDDDTEKTYDLPEKINLVTRHMRIDFPEFELEGKLLAQGEDIDDRWELIMEEGVATEKMLVASGTKITCPHCDEEFYLEGAEK